ncbi:MAG: hypothetical protein B6D56_07530 [Candidatus Omnitrophica bacterium 4484_70.1]|nr:MAG: hypothetical protein B6D56_07530 [Candidatus Omnitrophica bacterium 4484_70.1]
MSKIIIDESACVGCGLCVNSSPECFEMGEDGVAKVKSADCQDSNIQEVIDQCPVSAIKLEK